MMAPGVMYALAIAEYKRIIERKKGRYISLILKLNSPITLIYGIAINIQ